jgi:hypothetical protein
MTIARVKPAGWTYGEKFTSAQANALDENFALALDGDGGGSWEPDAAIVLTGDGGGAGWPMQLPNLGYNGTALTRIEPLSHAKDTVDGAYWRQSAINALDDPQVWSQTDVSASGRFLVMNIQPVLSAVLQSVQVFCFVSASQVPPPTTFPIFKIRWRELDSATVGVAETRALDYAADFGSTLGNYVTYWDATLDNSSAGFGDIGSTDRQYALTIEGQHGGGSGNGYFQILGVKTTWLPSKLSWGV